MRQSCRSHVPGRLLLGIAGLGVLVVLAATVGVAQAADPQGSSGDGVASDQGSTPAAVDCAFPIVADEAVANVAFPDTGATYWVMPLDLAAGDTVTVTGSFPYSRYMSFNTYDPSGASYGALHDSLVAADAGNTNPFASDGTLDAVARDYTVDVAPVPDPALISSSPSTVETGLGASWLVYRVYLPFDPDSPSGQESLPAITIDRAGGSQEVYAPCTTFGSEPGFEALVAAIVRDSLAGALPPAENPEFVTPGSSAGLFPNVDNKYVYATTTWAPGRLIVVRGRAPDFPDTPGQPLYPQQQLRYWSMCSNLLVDPAPVVACAADADTAIGPDGSYTYVVSADGDRPTDASLMAAHATWLPWFGPIGEALPESAKPTGNLILRNMLPAPGFTTAVQDIAVANSYEAAVAAMGDYYPMARYCDVEVFEQGGVEACFASALPAPVSPAFTG